MRLFSTITSKAAAAVIVTAGFLIAAQPSSALSISVHNGDGTGGVIASATGDVAVMLIDIFDSDPNGDIAAACDDVGADACLAKAWFSGQEPHVMLIQPDGSTFLLGEFTLNLTGVPWTDYHVEVLGAEIVDATGTLFTIDENGDIVDDTDDGITTMLMGGSVWFFFDDPILPLPLIPQGDAIVFAFLLELDLGSNGSVLIGQHPSIAVPEPAALALFGIGLAGLGVARRRKRTG